MKQTANKTPKQIFSPLSSRRARGVAFCLALAALLLTSCFSDDTTLAERQLSEIVIDGTSMKEVYDINKNETLTVTPRYTQTNGDKSVTTTWEIDQQTYSNEPTLTYTGKELGSWNCRLILENEDGKTFFPFKLNVNSPYEEGITILSRDSDGRPMLSFMQKPLDGSAPVFYDYDCLSLNNDDIFFASNPADMVQSAGSLIIACQGRGTEGDDVPTIYYINEKTMVVENMLQVREYDDFKPTILGIPSMDASGVAYPVLCENGKVYEFSTTEGALVKPAKLKYTYDQNIIVRDNGTGWNYELLVWDNELGALAQLYNGYGPYYCSANYHQTRETCRGTNNYFNGRTFCNMTYVRMTEQQAATAEPQVLVVVKNGMLVQKVVLATSFWKYNYDTSETVLSDNGGTKIAMVGECPLKPRTPAIANMTYYSLLFADGNKVRRWNYTTSQLLSDAGILQTVGTDDAVITGFEMSADHKRTYVAFYEPKQTGRNGSMWVIDTDKGDIIEKYDNICHMPVKIIYKKK